jgi:hypothetical protein
VSWCGVYCLVGLHGVGWCLDLLGQGGSRRERKGEGRRKERMQYLAIAEGKSSFLAVLLCIEDSSIRGPGRSRSACTAVRTGCMKYGMCGKGVSTGCMGKV